MAATGDDAARADLIELAESAARRQVDEFRAQLRHILGVVIEQDPGTARLAPAGGPGWQLGFWAVVLFHHFLVLGNIASFAAIPFGWWFGEAPWYLCFPAWFAIFWVTCSRTECVLHKLENRARARLGWPRTRSFVGHYYVGPFYRARAVWRRRGLAGLARRALH